MELTYPHICSRKDEIPSEALADLESIVVEKLGENFSDIFPQFSGVFVETTKSIEESWGKPVLCLKKGVRNWLEYIVVQSLDRNLFFDLQPCFTDKQGVIFDEDYEMLPEGWKEIYRWFNSFSITELGYSPMEWWNTPFRYEARLDLDDYEKGSGVSRKQTIKFSKDIGCERSKLRCWLLTEAEDALFINEEVCDRKVYHVSGKDLENFIEIDDPVKKMDEYLSHILSGFKAEGFNWRN
jgi:hypothetical protein